MAIHLRPGDAAWLYLDQASQPCHIAGVFVFSPPPAAGPEFARRLLAQFQAMPVFAPPFNYRLQGGSLGRIFPAWEELPAERIDLSYHFRYAMLPAPGGEPELAALVSRLHSQPLDFRRPLWEGHLIDGLEGGRFALYLKVHHAQFDGMAGVGLMRRCLSLQAEARHCPPPWTTRTSTVQPPNRGSIMPAVRGIATLARAALHSGQTPQAFPYGVAGTVLNGRISPRRSVVLQTFPLARIKAVARAAGVSGNDVFMALCGGALRCYLAERDALPAASLVAAMPVSLRGPRDTTLGNAITLIYGRMGTHIADPVARLRACHDSAVAAKTHLQTMPRAALADYTLLLMTPYFLQMGLGLAGRSRPMHSLVVSNISGDKRAQYLNGARLQQCYPVSALFHGQALNISAYSCGGSFSLGLVGCGDTLPGLGRVASYVGETLAELESALALPPPSQCWREAEGDPLAFRLPLDPAASRGEVVTD